MGSVLDIFNSSFLIFLGILVLVVALLVVYFESKMREQNHKIASMLSLVSTLAEDMHGVKSGLNHLAITHQQGGISKNFDYGYEQNHNLGENKLDINSSDLIEVSDDEESEDDYSENNSNVDEETDEQEIKYSTSENASEDENDNEDDDSINNVKVLKLNISGEKDETDEHYFDIDDNDVADLEEDFEPIESDTPEFTEITDDYAEEVLDLKYELDEPKEENNLVEKDITTKPSNLKTISIDLGEDNHHSEEFNIDYKKLQLPKLRSIAVEKGLASNTDASKLKKPELLKLLGSE